MAKLRQRLRRTAAAAVSAALLLTAAQMPALTASAAEPVLRMNLIGGGSVIGIGWQLEAPDGLSGYSVTLDGKKVRPEADGTFSSYDYAMDMTQPHTVTVSKGGRQVLKKEASVCSYLNSLLADSTYSEYFPVAKAMLIYGGAVQEYFGVDTEHLASEGIDSTAALNREIPELELQERFLEYLEWFDVYPVTYTGMNLAVQSELRFSLFFETKPGCTAEEAEAYLHDYSFGGEPAVITPYGENGWRMYRTVNVKDLSKVFELTEPDGGFWIVSPLQYLTLAEKSGDEALIRVCKALYNYATVEKRAASPIRSIELKQEEYYDHESMIAGLGTIEEYPPSPEILKKNPGAFRDSLANPLTIEKVSSTGQTNEIHVWESDTDQISYPAYSSDQDRYYEECWRDAQYDWMNREDYEMAEKLMCSDPKNEWYRVSALFEEGRDEDILLLYFRYHDMAETEIGIQNIQFDENGKLTVSIASLLIHDYDEDIVIKAYRLELPHGALSFDAGESGGDETVPAVTTTTESVSETTETTAVTEETEAQPPIRSIGLNVDTYYDVESISWLFGGVKEYIRSEGIPLDADVLVKNAKKYDASLPDQLAVEKVSSAGKKQQIPVLTTQTDQIHHDGFGYGFDHAADWLKQEDYETAEKTLRSETVEIPFDSYRVSALFEEGEDEDILLLYITFASGSGEEINIQNLRLDENGRLTVSIARIGGSDDSEGSVVKAYRLTLPHGALSGAVDESGSGETTDVTEPVINPTLIRGLNLIITHFTTKRDDYYEDCESYEEMIAGPLLIQEKFRDSRNHIWYVYTPVLNKQTATLGKELDFSSAPEWLKQEDYEAAEAAMVSLQASDPDEPTDSFRVSAKFEQGEAADVLYLYLTSDAADGSLDIAGLYLLDQDGKMTVSAAFCSESDDCSAGLYAFRLELPHGALSFDAGESGGDETEPAVTTATESVSETTETTAVTEETEAQPPIRSIEMKTDRFWDWTVGEDHAYMWDPDDLQDLMLGEDGKKKYERSVPEQLCLERTDRTGQTVKIPVLGREFSEIEIDQGDDWNDMPAWLKQSDYKEAEKLLSSNSENWEYWSHVSAKYEQDDEKDVLLLFVTLYELEGSFALQSLQLDENGKLTVNTSYLEAADYSDGEIVDAYRLEFPKGTLSGEYIPEDDGGQQPEDDAVIRDIELDTEYYYDPEKMYDCGSGMFDEVDPDSEMLVRDPEAFRASLPETLVIEKTDGTGKTVQIPVLKQDRAADEAWRIWGRNNPAPDWLKKQDYKAAEKALCDPMVGMQRVAARLEQGEETDVLLLYFTWNFMSGDLELRNLKFDENGKLTVGVSFCRTTQFGWGEDLYAYRLELPHGALTNDISGLESGGDETEPVIRKVSGGYTHLPDVSSYEFDPNQEEMWWESYTPETLKEYLINKNKQRYSQDPVHLENTDASGETQKYYVRDSTFTCMDLSESFGWDGEYQSDSLREIAPSWMTQADYDALDEMFDSHAWISARLELCGDKDVLVIYHEYSEVDGDPRVRKILFENGSLSVLFSTEGWAPDFGDELLDIIRLEFPAGAFSGSAEPDADRTVTVIPPLKAQPDIRSVDLEIGRYSLPYWLYLEQEDSDLMSWGLRFPVLNKQTAVLGKELDFSNAPEWLKQEDYEAAEAALVSGQTSDPSEPMDSFRVSAKYERGEDVDVLYLYFTSDAADGSLDISHLYLDRDGKLRVSARFCGESDVCSTGLYAFRLEFPAGAIC